MKRRGFVWWRGLLALIFVALIAAILFPVFVRDSTPGRIPSCQSNLRQISLGVVQYAQDYDEDYPPVILNDTAGTNSPYGWADALHPYLKSAGILQCSLEGNVPTAPDPMQRGYTDYWFNRNLAERNPQSFTDARYSIAFGDGNDGHDETTARYSLSQFPEAWRNNQNSPAYRHREGANYAFADGHAKWLKPENVTNTVTNGQPTFRVD